MILKYPYYKDNPNLRLKVVETYNASKEYFSNCRKIDGKYYIIGIDLIYIDGKYYLTSKLIFDFEKLIYVKTKALLLYGVVAFENNELIFGYFSKNIYNNCTIHCKNTGLYICMNFKICTELFFTECKSTGMFYITSQLSPFEIKSLNNKKLLINNKNKTYNIVDNDNLSNVMKNYDAFKLIIDKDNKYLSTYTTGFTFGAEIETINGALPDYILNRYGVIPCKDGSIIDENGYYPPEYVTVPLMGAKGLQTIKDVAIEITKRSEINNKCSLHLHLGGFVIDKVFLISLFKLCLKIQNDVFKMFPFYKTNERKLAGKAKDYCKKLPNILNNYTGTEFNNFINKSYKDFYGFLTGGLDLSKDFNFKNKHNPWGGAKWNIESRYHWINFTNFVFGKQQTIEFRLHSATTNHDKIINWLFICIAIVKYAQNNTLKCINNEKICFVNDVLNVFNNNKNYSKILSNNLKTYYNSRVEYFENDKRNENYLSNQEIQEDKTFTFNIAKIS